MTKLRNLKDLISKLNTNNNRIMYMGDDIPDIPAMKLVGLAAALKMQLMKLKKYRIIFHLKGGKGAARDIIEQILKVQGLWLKGYDANYD